MKKARASLGVALLLVSTLAANNVLGQRGRPVSDPAKAEAENTQSSPTTPAPQSVPAKYEGGVLGYNQKMDGSLFFDDGNRRLLFRDERQKQVLFIPYEALLAAFADTKSRRPAVTDAIGRYGGIYGLPALLVRRKHRYLTIQYKDPDTQAAGITSFKLDNKEILDSVVATLASKAGLVKRGEAYLRRTETAPQVTGAKQT